MPKRTKPPPFRAHAIILAELTGSVMTAQLVGTASLKIEFDPVLPEFTWLRQALSQVANVHPLFKPTGVCIKMRPDFCVIYDLQGEVQGVYDWVEIPEPPAKPWMDRGQWRQNTTPTMH